MVRKVTLLLVMLTVAGLAFAVPTAAQQPSDTLCVSVETLQSMRQEITELRRRDSLNTQIKNNLRAQIRRREIIAEQDSIIIGTLRQEMMYRKEQIELRDRRINNLQTQLRKQEFRKWVYFGGGVVTVIAGAWVAGQAAN